MTREEIVRGLRCSASTEEKKCVGCPWRVREDFEGQDWWDCNVDQMAMDAADLLENDRSQILALQRELALRQEKLDCAAASAEKLRRQNGELRDAAAQVTRLAGDAAAEREWVSVKDRLPEEDEEEVLAIVSGRPKRNLTLENVAVIAVYCGKEGWYVNEYPEWEDPTVTYWMPVPEPPGEGEHG